MVVQPTAQRLVRSLGKHISVTLQTDSPLWTLLVASVVRAVRRRPWGTKLPRCIATNACQQRRDQ